MTPKTPPDAPESLDEPVSQTVVIRYRLSLRESGAVYTKIEATEELAVSLRYANDPVVVSLPTPALAGMVRSFADLWPGDEITIEVGPLSITIRLRDEPAANISDGRPVRDR